MIHFFEMINSVVLNFVVALYNRILMTGLLTTHMQLSNDCGDAGGRSKRELLQ
jgi:hypothetical protein